MTTKYEIKDPAFVLTALALALCTFMEVLDFTITNVSVPYIAGSLGVSDSEGTWIITLYMVGNAIILPVSGWLSEKVGPIRLIIFASALFGISSWLCAIAFSFPMLCICRFFQGAVSGPLIPMSQVLLVDIFPDNKKQMAVALWAMVALVGPIAGPIVGGWITQDFNWRWIFYINLPVSVFSVAVLVTYMRKYIGKISNIKLDWIGLVLLVIGITCLQILVDKGRQLDWFESPLIRLLGAVSLVCLSLLVTYEFYHPSPLIEVRLLKIRSFALGTLLLGISFMVFFAPLVITPLWLETFMGYDPLKVGLALSTMGIIPFLCAPLVGKLMGSGHLKWMVAFSFFAMGLAFLYFTTFNTSVTFSKIAWSRFYLGIGLATYIAPLLSLSLSQIPLNKMARASAILQFFRIFMSGVGTSLYTAFWSDRATFHHSNLTSVLTLANHNLDQIKQVAQNRLSHIQKPFLELLNHSVDAQAYMLATNDVMLISAVGLFSLIIIVAFINVSAKEIRKRGVHATH